MLSQMKLLMRLVSLYVVKVVSVNLSHVMAVRVGGLELVLIMIMGLKHFESVSVGLTVIIARLG